MAKGGANPRSANGHRRRMLRRAVAARGDPCWICGYPIDRALPTGHPLSLQVDELLPVSRGGSPTDPANCAATHACCNGWRKAKPVGLVEATKAAVAAAFGGWNDPLDFVRKAKALAAGSPAAATPPPRPTTEW